MKDFKCTLLEQGIHLQGIAQDLNGKDYPVSLLMSKEQENLPWEDGMKWAKEKGGNLPTRAQGLVLSDHQNEINKVLEEVGLTRLAGWYWTCEEYKNNSDCASVVYVAGGNVFDNGKCSNFYVRPVSAFPFE